MNDREVVVDTVDRFLVGRGFTRKASTWYRAGEDIVTVVNLQRSRFGPAFYVNVGLWLLALGDASLPKENACHVRTRLSRLVGDDERELEALLDLGDPRFGASRGDVLGRLLDQYLGPILDSAVSTTTLRSPVGVRLLRRALIEDDAAELLQA